MLWISYGLIMQLNSISEFKVAEKVKEIKEEKI